MLQEKDLKEGVCIVKPLYTYVKMELDNMMEGVIIQVNNAKTQTSYKVLWYEELDDCCINTKTGLQFSVYTETLTFRDFKNCELAIVPHFCSVENVYKILNKYAHNGTFEAMVVRKVPYVTDNYSLTYYVYLKINNNKYIQVVIFDKHHYRTHTKTLYAWVKEFDTIEELQIAHQPHSTIMIDDIIELYDAKEFSEYCIEKAGLPNSYVSEIYGGFMLENRNPEDGWLCFNFMDFDDSNYRDKNGVLIKTSENMNYGSEADYEIREFFENVEIKSRNTTFLDDNGNPIPKIKVTGII